jgi:hypothetical protein
MKIGRDEYRRAARIRVDNTHKKRETADRYFKIVDRGVLYLLHTDMMPVWALRAYRKVERTTGYDISMTVSKSALGLM